MVHEAQTIRDVITVGPHAGEPELTDGLGLGRFLLRYVDLDHVDLNDGAFLDLHRRKRPEDAVLVFRAPRLVAQNAEVAKIAVILGEIQAVADHEFVGDVEADVIRLHGALAAVGLIDQRGDA
jgi:hypothetical protein